MKALQVHPRDDVAVAITDLKAGETVEAGNKEVTLTADIPRGHKFALRDIALQEGVIKYGYAIGKAVADISAGDHVHVHNIKTGLTGVEEYTYTPKARELQAKPTRSFQGYRRTNGKAGVRNEVWIIPLSGCANHTSKSLADQVKNLPDNVDGVFAFPHPYGCSQLGDDHEWTRVILAALADHPNAGAVLMISLGCENNQMDTFIELLKERGVYDEKRMRFMITQDVDNEMETGEVLLKECIDYAADFHREEIPASELVVGLKCGGSDGFSGLTANPLLGAFSDDLIAQGGSTILTEVPEMFGAETILMNRAVDEKIYNKTVDLINNFKEYFLRHNQVVYENPSPGNKKGGITTLEDKSLGCTQKGGDAPVVDVINYGEQVKTKGLNLLQGPGNDIVSITALAAAGAQLLLFTTGRGNPLGAPVPSIKVASNNELAARKKHWIDFSAGDLVEVEGCTMEVLEERFMDSILEHASGKKARNEENNNREIAIFKDGVIL